MCESLASIIRHQTFCYYLFLLFFCSLYIIFFFGQTVFCFPSLLFACSKINSLQNNICSKNENETSWLNEKKNELTNFSVRNETRQLNEMSNWDRERIDRWCWCIYLGYLINGNWKNFINWIEWFCCSLAWEWFSTRDSLFSTSQTTTHRVGCPLCVKETHQMYC